MTISAVIGNIQTQLGLISGNPLKRIYASPKEAINLGDFPCAVLGLPDNAQFIISNDNRGRSNHQYSIALWIFVGALGNTPYNELMDRVMLWPDRLRSVLTPDVVKLTGSVVYTGGAETDNLTVNYRVGEIAWGDPSDNYYGLIGIIPIYERFSFG